jgi:hypothetical protein
MNLRKIAEAIAKEASLEFVFDSKEDPSFDRQDQDHETDLSFLQQLCKSAGLTLKVTDKQLVIFNQQEYEAKASVQTITLNESLILNWRFERAQSETYKSVTVSYRDPKQKKADSSGGYNIDLEKIDNKTENPAVISYTYTDEKVGSEGQEFQLKTRAKSIEEARRLAKAKLRELNSRKVVGQLTLVGDVKLVSGIVITVKGFGSVDGDFFIDEVEHTVSRQGFTTSINIHIANPDY